MSDFQLGMFAGSFSVFSGLVVTESVYVSAILFLAVIMCIIVNHVKIKPIGKGVVCMSTKVVIVDGLEGVCFCPHCDECFDFGDRQKYNYCYECGTKLDWSDIPKAR